MEKDKQFGKRDMFYNIQKQMIAIEGADNVEDKYLELKRTMVELEKILQVEEKIHGISTDYLIDADILKDSKRISLRWSAELKNKQIPFYATVKGDSLDCYDWEDGDRLQIIDCIEDLDSEHNEYLWMAINLDRGVKGAVSTYQINII